MSDTDIIVLTTLKDILYSIRLIQSRFQAISSSDDFLEDEVGLEKLDSISMRLIAIGEGFKQIDKLTDHTLLSKYPGIEWKNVKGIRDILSHHYFDMDAEVIYQVCKYHLISLLDATEEMIGLYATPTEERVKAMKEAEVFMEEKKDK